MFLNGILFDDPDNQVCRQIRRRLCPHSTTVLPADPAARLTHPIAPSEGRICCGSAVHLPADPALSDPAVHLLTDCRQMVSRGVN